MENINHKELAEIPLKNCESHEETKINVQDTRIDAPTPLPAVLVYGDWGLILLRWKGYRVVEWRLILMSQKQIWYEPYAEGDKTPTVATHIGTEQNYLSFPCLKFFLTNRITDKNIEYSHRNVWHSWLAFCAYQQPLDQLTSLNSSSARWLEVCIYAFTIANLSSIGGAMHWNSGNQLLQ